MDTRLREIGIEVEGSGAVVVVREGRVQRDALRRLDLTVDVKIARRDTDIQILTFVY